MKKTIFSILLWILAISMMVINSSFAVCNNSTVKGVYDITLTNPDKTIVKGGISFNGLSNVFIPYTIYPWGNYTITIFPNSVRSSGTGAYYIDKYCKLHGFGAYTYNNVKYQIQMTTGAMTVVSGHATYGVGKFNEAAMVLKTR